MKKLLIIILLFICIKAHSATYYVATDGSNSNPGTREAPFATINRAWTAVQNNSDDIIYIRGGIYTYSMIGVTTLSGKNGISTSRRLSIYNYPGEKPIIDFLDYTLTTATQIIRVEDVDFIHIKGIELRHNIQLLSGRLGYGLRIASRVNDGLFEMVNVHHCGGWGIVVYGGSDVNGLQSNRNVFYRCDSHHHSDRYSTRNPWGGSDGFLVNSFNGYAYPSLGTIFIECRAWWNSDDGWDSRLFNGDVTYINCWAFWNGYQPGQTLNNPDIWEKGGNGYGYKLGSRRASHTTEVMRTMYRCLAFENREVGIQCEWSDRTEDGHSFSSNIYNNTAFGNLIYGFLHGSLPVGTTWLRNNLSYGNSDYVVNHSSIDDEYNASSSPSWYRRDFISVGYDFVSHESTGSDGPRGEEGELPELNFLKLYVISDLIDVGINVGLPYEGDGPDIGAFEFGSEPEPPITDPEIKGLLKLYYNGKWRMIKYQNNLTKKQ